MYQDRQFESGVVHRMGELVVLNMMQSFANSRCHTGVADSCPILVRALSLVHISTLFLFANPHFLVRIVQP